MADYTFRIRQGSRSCAITAVLADNEAAWEEAAATCSDLIRDSIKHLRDSPEWRLEVTDETGNIRHLFRLTAETFDQ
jgi:hypothetical protein